MAAPLHPTNHSPALQWFLTWNNYPEDWKDVLQKSVPNFKGYACQQEVGANGTRHIQVSSMGERVWRQKGRVVPSHLPPPSLGVPQALLQDTIHPTKGSNADSALGEGKEPAQPEGCDTVLH